MITASSGPHHSHFCRHSPNFYHLPEIPPGMRQSVMLSVFMKTYKCNLLGSLACPHNLSDVGLYLNHVGLS